MSAYIWVGTTRPPQCATSDAPAAQPGPVYPSSCYRAAPHNPSLRMRTVNLPISSGTVTLEAGAVVTARLYYRRVEDGVLGDIVPIPGNVVTVDEEGTSTETQIGGWSKDARLTLYIELKWEAGNESVPLCWR